MAYVGQFLGKFESLLTVRLIVLLVSFFLTSSVGASEHRSAAEAHCISERSSEPELVAKCMENQEQAKARYRERLARGLASGDFRTVRGCREQTIDDALDHGFDPADQNWFAFEDCFLARKWPSFKTLTQEWDDLDRDSLRIECAAEVGDRSNAYHRSWLAEYPQPTKDYWEFDLCYFEAIASALGYETNCDEHNGERADLNSKGCLNPWSFPPIEPGYGEKELEGIRAHITRRKCAWGMGSKEKLARICTEVKSGAE